MTRARCLHVEVLKVARIRADALIAILAGLIGLVAAPRVLAQDAPAAPQDSVRTIQTKYYALYTDLDGPRAREAAHRITLLAEEYHRRTRGLAGSVDRKLPFFLFADLRLYRAAGGPPGTAGVFTGDRLMAILNERDPEQTWHTVQHEGFHQFVIATIGPEIPIWANEGLAEYFGHGVYTGDSFITGLIPPERLARVQYAIKEGKFKSLREMMLTPHELWNIELARENYDQAWSMVHFLAQGDEGRYQDVFFRFLRDVSRGDEWERAWERRFGTDVNGFQRRWEAYWLGQPGHPTADLYAKAAVATVTSFYARAFSRQQIFEDLEAFADASEAGELKAHPNDWLPPELLHAVIRKAADVGTWWIERKPGRWMIVCQTPEGTVWEGRFKVKRGRVDEVTVAQRNK